MLNSKSLIGNRKHNTKIWCFNQGFLHRTSQLDFTLHEACLNIRLLLTNQHSSSPRQIPNYPLLRLMDTDVVEQDTRTLLVWPPPPAQASITLSYADLECLKPEEFLNDSIIDFYLQYIQNKVHAYFRKREREQSFLLHQPKFNNKQVSELHSELQYIYIYLFTLNLFTLFTFRRSLTFSWISNPWCTLNFTPSPLALSVDRNVTMRQNPPLQLLLLQSPDSPY